MLHTVLYRVEGKVYGYETQAVNCKHAVSQFRDAAGDHDVLFVDLGNQKEVYRLYKLEQSKVCDVYVWKIIVNLRGNTQWQGVMYVGADRQWDAVVSAREYRRDLGEDTQKYTFTARQTPFYAQRYGVLDIEEFEV